MFTLLLGVMGGLVAQAICALWDSFAYHVHTFLVLIHYHLTALLTFSYIFQSNLFQHLKVYPDTLSGHTEKVVASHAKGCKIESRLWQRCTDLYYL